MKKYGGLVLSVEEQFVSIGDIATVVGKNDFICRILVIGTYLKSNSRNPIILHEF